MASGACYITATCRWVATSSDLRARAVRPPVQPVRPVPASDSPPALGNPHQGSDSLPPALDNLRRGSASPLRTTRLTRTIPLRREAQVLAPAIRHPEERPQA